MSDVITGSREVRGGQTFGKGMFGLVMFLAGWALGVTLAMFRLGNGGEAKEMQAKLAELARFKTDVDRVVPLIGKHVDDMDADVSKRLVALESGTVRLERDVNQFRYGYQVTFLITERALQGVLGKEKWDGAVAAAQDSLRKESEPVPQTTNAPAPKK